MSKLPVFVHTEKTAGGAVAEYFGFEKGVKTPSENARVDVTYYGQHGQQLRIFLKTEDDRAQKAKHAQSACFRSEPNIVCETQLVSQIVP